MRTRKDLGTVSRQSLARAIREKKERDMTAQAAFTEPLLKYIIANQDKGDGVGFVVELTAEEIHSQDNVVIINKG